MIITTAIAVIAAVSLSVDHAVKASGTAVTASRNVIVLDPGHGGVDSGASGRYGTVEKDINLSISLILRDMLAISGYEVLMTRETDVSLHDESSVTIRSKKQSDLINRLKIVDSHPEGIYVGIHQNNFTQYQYSGAQIFYSVNNDRSRALAESIRVSVAGLVQPENSRVVKPLKKESYILSNASVPAVIVECGFLSNQEEERRLVDPEYQKALAFAILMGIVGNNAENIPAPLN